MAAKVVTDAFDRRRHIEILFELVLQIVVELFGEALLHSFSESTGARRLFTLLGYALLGAVFGALTITFMPAHLIRNPDLRIANVVMTPLLVAALMSWIGATRRRKEKRVVRMEEFTHAYAFALSFAVARYFGAD
ncbi:MAG TPA: hypothetical protein VE974_28095 [Thermoanaerobaculia bacterium]|nr:hypothetical protein [Thermoanaerobaculia bacterium]